ncbi:MAG: DNA alkylation repair protein [Candidatus Polarisedimenticolia bacterium]
MKEILEQLRSVGKESYRKTLQRHGVPEPILGASIAEMKKIVKKVRRNHELALQLYDSGIYDARYLAGLIAEDDRMTVKDLTRWVESANCPALSEYTVPWVTAEGPHGMKLALKWIESKKESVASSGWATLSCLAALRDDAELDLALFKRLLGRVRESIHEQPNRVRYVMNGFVIGVGCYVKELTALALETAKAVGPVTVDMGDTACEVPDAAAYIRKVKERGSLGKKRKTVKC